MRSSVCQAKEVIDAGAKAHTKDRVVPSEKAAGHRLVWMPRSRLVLSMMIQNVGSTNPNTAKLAPA